MIHEHGRRSATDSPEDPSATSSPRLVGHVVEQFLPLSETFIYSQVCAQIGNGVILTKRRINAAVFPFEPVRAVDPRGRLETALRRRLLTALPIPSKFERGIRREAADAGCDLLHAHFGWAGRVALYASEPLGLPMITSFYGLDVYSPGWRWRKGSARSMFSDLFAKGSGFTCVGPTAREELIRNGCPSELLDVVKIGIDLKAFPYRTRSAKRPLVILQIARLTEKKGVDLTLRAFARARPHLGEAELWIVGDGDLRRPLVTLSQDLGIGDGVRFLGALPHSEVQDLIARAHIGIQPSRTAKNGDKEGSPTVLLEMQAVGLPVVASNHADIPSIVAYPEELLEEGDWVGVATALIRVAGLSESERLERAAAGRELIEREHDSRKIARQLENTYREVSQRFHSRNT